MPSPHQHNLVLAPDVWAEIEKRTPPGYGGASATVSTIIRRYVALLAESRARNRATFTADELTLLRAALAGSTTGVDITNALMVYTDGSEMESVAPALITKIEALSPTDKIGLIDSIERASIAEQRGKTVAATPA